MTCGSLFSGYGGADLGLSQAGFRHLWLCEIDKDCRRVLDARFPGVPVYDDVTKFPAETVEVPDVVWLSPPCQDLSVAGKRAGLAGERSGLFYDAIEIVRRLAARGTRFALMEQVPGLLSSHGGRDFQNVIEAFSDAGALDVCWRVLDSRWFGVPQRRRRIYLVADFGGERASEILFEPEGLRGDSASSRTEGQEAAREAGSGAEEYCIKGAAIGRKPEAGPQYGEILEGETFTLQTNEVHAVMVEAPEAGSGAEEYCAIPIQDCRDIAKHQNGLGIGSDGDPSYTIDATGAQGVSYCVGFPSKGVNDPSECELPMLRVENPPAVCYRWQNKGDGLVESDTTGTVLAGAGNPHPVKTPGYVVEPAIYDWSAGGSNELLPNANALRSGAEHTSQIVVEVPDVANTLGHGGGRGWRNDLDNQTYIVEAPDVAPTLNASMAKGMNGQDVGALVVQSELYRWHRMDTRMDGPLDESPACVQNWGTGGNNVPMVLEEEPVVHPPLTAANNPSRSPQSAEITASVEAVHQATTIVRRLLPVECLRLQAMPDWWCEVEGKPLSDSAIYRMCGNGVTASVARWIGERVREVLDK